jgi:hypothetical protein
MFGGDAVLDSHPADEICGPRFVGVVVRMDDDEPNAGRS